MTQRLFRSAVMVLHVAKFAPSTVVHILYVGFFSNTSCGSRDGQMIVNQAGFFFGALRAIATTRRKFKSDDFFLLKLDQFQSELGKLSSVLCSLIRATLCPRINCDPVTYLETQNQFSCKRKSKLMSNLEIQKYFDYLVMLILYLESL